MGCRCVVFLYVLPFHGRTVCVINTVPASSTWVTLLAVWIISGCANLKASTKSDCWQMLQGHKGWLVQSGKKYFYEAQNMWAVTALLFPSHVFCSVFVGVWTGCLNHKSPAIWSVTCSAWAPLYGWLQVSPELRYTVVTDIGLAELTESAVSMSYKMSREWLGRSDE